MFLLTVSRYNELWAPLRQSAKPEREQRRVSGFPGFGRADSRNVSVATVNIKGTTPAHNGQRDGVWGTLGDKTPRLGSGRESDAGPPTA